MDKKGICVAFTGPSNSGKTTLILKISNILQDRGFKVSIIKNDPKDKARFDIDGKDSFRFFQTGADVAVVSPNRTTIFKNSSSDIDYVIRSFGEFDYLLIEGLKSLPFSRIATFREFVDSSYLKYSEAVAVPKDLIFKSDVKLDILDINSPEDVIAWIDKNVKAVDE
jgi:molybdopterin-guanine dinucleotide biosynthesis protein B